MKLSSLEREQRVNHRVDFLTFVSIGTLMNGTEKVVEHLKIIQSVVDRLGRNSLWTKTWSLTLIVAAMLLIIIDDVQNTDSVPILILPILGFWILDGYFLWQERLFRKVYNEVRVQSDTDFEMNQLKHRHEPKCSWVSAIISRTLIIFYAIEIAFTVFVFLIVDAKALSQ